MCNTILILSPLYSNPNPNQPLLQKLVDNFQSTVGFPGPSGTSSSEVLISIVGNFGEFQEFHCSSSSSSQYRMMTANAILAGINNNNSKCSILILFLYPLLNIRIHEAPVKSPGEINIWLISAILFP